MSDTPVYMIANLHINDAETYQHYEKGFFPILKKHGGTFLTYDDNTVTLEGAHPREGRVVMFQFPSEAAAQAWFADPEYQAISEHRRAGTNMEFLTMIHGLPPR
tara:strand:+ start:1226 stop:1537 length:312 start_codon:yes stop_codon:yes gene_type:complete